MNEEEKQAIETLLTAYEKEKEKNKKLQNKAKELIFEKQELTSALLDSTPNDKIKAKIEELENYYRELYKQDNSPNEFLIGQDCLSKLSIIQEVKQSLLEKE